MVRVGQCAYAVRRPRSTVRSTLRVSTPVSDSRRARRLREDPPPWMNFTQLADYLGGDPKTLRRYAKIGMPYSRIGGENKVKLEKFWAWFDEHEVRGEPQETATEFARASVRKLRLTDAG